MSSNTLKRDIVKHQTNATHSIFLVDLKGNHLTRKISGRDFRFQGVRNASKPTEPHQRNQSAFLVTLCRLLHKHKETLARWNQRQFGRATKAGQTPHSKSSPRQRQATYTRINDFHHTNKKLTAIKTVSFMKRVRPNRLAIDQTIISSRVSRYRRFHHLNTPPPRSPT